MTTNHYEVLGVAADAGEEEIRKQYAQLIREFRQALASGEPPAPERLDQLREAYKTLSDAGLRAEYDRLLGMGANQRSGLWKTIGTGLLRAISVLAIVFGVFLLVTAWPILSMGLETGSPSGGGAQMLAVLFGGLVGGSGLMFMVQGVVGIWAASRLARPRNIAQGARIEADSSNAAMNLDRQHRKLAVLFWISLISFVATFFFIPRNMSLMIFLPVGMFVYLVSSIVYLWPLGSLAKAYQKDAALWVVATFFTSIAGLAVSYVMLSKIKKTRAEPA